ncbi:hypothetical protein SAMN05421505_10514 [Sinosporangium album]|uniref:Uncharacterized protein n=1 Tax=Sinosporangium album TaxID=504805 RepID=A0A1G7UXW4_9ACTN|nr:hypothetical protein SAMN05421505_10514 [Sinosporangium album]
MIRWIELPQTIRDFAIGTMTIRSYINFLNATRIGLREMQMKKEPVTYPRLTSIRAVPLILLEYLL